MMKKGMAEMWWIILGAVVALVVLVVLMVIFAGKTGKLETGLSSCESKGGVCVVEDTDCPANTLTSPVFDCGSGYECCLGTPKKCPEDCKEADCSKIQAKRDQWCP